MHALGVHGCSVITATIAQNSTGVRAVDPVSATMVQAQLDALHEDLPPAAIKLGMLTSRAAVESVAKALSPVAAPVVCDPVLVSSSGTALLEGGAQEPFKRDVLPHVDLLTPNRPEAETLLGRRIRSDEEVESAAEDLLQLGPQSVLIKGGHAEGPYAQDFWTDGATRWWITLPRLETRSTHGTGCVLSSALAACLALGHTVPEALVIARAYLQQGLRTAPGLGKGHGPLAFGGWPSSPEDFPWLTPTAAEGRDPKPFPDCGSAPLGLYPIVDRLEWLKKLLPLGIPTVQLRIKDLEGEALDNEVRGAIEYAKAFEGCRLFINDRWELALQHGAYGVHLGQDDLPGADLDALRNAGLRLGISTHSYSELARAWSCRPSYVALGTLFKTTSKVMDYPPLGLDAFRRMRRLQSVPTVAIGGINLSKAPEVLAAGADGLAVISEITQAPDLEGRVREWREVLGHANPHFPRPPREDAPKGPK
jgi:hydroxymethylpyrimidine kinase/phosphomethylpyrimidine kinase/thiamine-phosphate diphosphorylase